MANIQYPSTVCKIAKCQTVLTPPKCQTVLTLPSHEQHNNASKFPIQIRAAYFKWMDPLAGHFLTSAQYLDGHQSDKKTDFFFNLEPSAFINFLGKTYLCLFLVKSVQGKVLVSLLSVKVYIGTFKIVGKSLVFDDLSQVCINSD